MFDSRLDYPNEFPVEVAAPDITPYQKGNGCADYVHTFPAAMAGPHVVITAIVHGNELCGAIALDWLLQQNPRPLRGTLSLAFVNVDAYLAFDPNKANLTRWLEEDLNRLWGEDCLNDPGRRLTVELARARAIRPLLDAADLLLDLHSMQTPCPPILLSGRHRKGEMLAREACPALPVLADAGHAEGKRMRDYGGFDKADSPKNALLVECGQNWAPSAADVAIRTTAAFLRHSGIMADDFGLDTLPADAQSAAAGVYEVGELVTVQTEHFRFAQTWVGFEHLPKGTLIGHDGDKPVIAPYEPTVLIMPSRQLFAGKTAVRLAYPRPPATS